MKVNFTTGSHRPDGLWLPMLCEYAETFSFEFTESCLYTPADWENDTNKLCGFTLGLLPHKVTSNATYPTGDWNNWLFPVHYNSARLVWRPEWLSIIQEGKTNHHLTGLIELFSYVYEQGVRSMFRIGTCEINQVYSGYNKVDAALHMISVEGVGALTRVHNFGKLPTLGWITHPFMGGNAPAVQNISLEVSR